jgi:hypothetical protein
MHRVDHAGILAEGLFAWLHSKAQRPSNYELCAVFIRRVSIDQRYDIAAAIDSGVYLADGTEL